MDALIIQGVNPGFDLPDADGFAESLSKTRLVVSCSPMEDETSSLAGFVCPEPHFLESWNDGEPFPGTFTLTQPAIPALREARTLRASLGAWAGGSREDLQILREHWEKTIYPEMGAEDPFGLFFDRALQAGFVERKPEGGPQPLQFQASAVKPVAVRSAGAKNGFALVLYPKVGIRDGSHAHNPWLQELPDPVTKTVWDNYVCFSVETARSLDVRQGDVVRLVSEDGKNSLELPAFLQPGQHDRVVAVALGYGRKGTDRFAKIGPQWWEGKDTLAAGSTVGRNAAPFLRWENGTLRCEGSFVKVEKTGLRADLACTQDYHSLHVPKHLAPAGGEVREAVRETTLAAYSSRPTEAVPEEGGEKEPSLWKDDHPYKGHHWGMVVDLSACTGCSACVIGCQAENNVPVVGKDEVKRHREMSWIRIDRYYSGKGGNVHTVHQPMMCQHCDNAPCETVCPVLATVHSREGLNQQIYNRCVGTRFCANNCPYKVRRFNWFDYAHEDRLQNMVLNPDVTIRSRGVMEKCSLCIQRIQEARFEARRQGRDIQDGEIRTACQQSCPTSAIHFGDMNDPASVVSRKTALPRSYAVLGELNVRPSVHYQAVVRNAGDEEEGRGS